jgi:hypothetical protein
MNAGPDVVRLWRAVRPSRYKPLWDAAESAAMRFLDLFDLVLVIRPATNFEDACLLQYQPTSVSLKHHSTRYLCSYIIFDRVVNLFSKRMDASVSD